MTTKLGLAVVACSVAASSACSGDDETTAGSTSSGPDGGADAGAADAAGAADGGGADANVALADAATDAPELELVRVEVAQGVVEGAVGERGTMMFYGIPFAEPPTGDRRWRPPTPHEPWRGVRSAVDPMGQCVQGDGLAASPGVPMTEDCLQLNVFTPNLDPADPLPVMVWIHGGANTTGSAVQRLGDQMAYDGAALVEGGARDVVVVTLNYRLNNFGFFAHPALTRENGTSGNQGLLDQQLALRWVRDNIAAFGGDPGQVALFGESAGAWDICFHMVAPDSANLFHAAILQSGSCAGKGPARTLARAEADGVAFAMAQGCDQADPVGQLDCLRQLSIDLIPRTFPSGGDPHLGGVVDGMFLTGQPDDSFDAGRFHQVPTMMGTNTHEGALFVDTSFTTQADYLAALETRFGADAPTIAARYSVADYPAPYEALRQIMTDRDFLCPQRWLAERISARVPVYFYRWNRAADANPVFTDLGAAHAVELNWVWGWWRAFGSPAEEMDLTSEVMGYWTRHGAQSNPNGDRALTWPTWSTSSRSTLLFDTELATETGYRADACDLWATIAY